MDAVKWKISYEDRVGFIFDISQIISQCSINIKGFELFRDKYIFIELESLDEELTKMLLGALSKVPGVKLIEPIEYMPWEEREKQLQAVLDSVSEGIIAVDKNGMITTINPVAKKVLHLENEDVCQKPIKEILSEDKHLTTCLKTGKPYNNKEIVLNSAGGRRRFISSGRPLINEKGIVIGAVVSIKDMADVHKLVYQLTKPSMITFEDIIGTSPALKKAVHSAKMVARGEFTVLLRGESGTGKELFARAIHMESPRASQPFIPVNCAALPDALLESELFGYVEGAFTGAQKGGKAGLFELAHNGTIFLDEVGEISSHLQAKLLRVLQEGKVRRIGDKEEAYINVRIVAATNRNLEAMVQKGDFREDIYYRLNVFPVYIPPLRERTEDIAILANFFIKKFCNRMGKKTALFHKEALRKLGKHSWPGNVRELENIIQRAVVLGDPEIITGKDIILDIPYEKEFEKSPQLTYASLKEAVEKVEKDLLVETLGKNASIRQMAKRLGVSHATILNKMKKYGINKTL